MTAAAHIKMLREFGMTPGGGLRDACLWAADEIERLTKELAVQKGVVDMVYIPVRDLAEKNERLRAALTAISQTCEHCMDDACSALGRMYPEIPSPSETGVKP